MGQRIIGLSADLISHPGETLKEVLEHENMSQQELAYRISLDKKTVSQIINGVAPISCETALKLEKVFNLKASFWNALQSNYNDELLRVKEKETVTDDELIIAEKIPYKDLLLYGYIKKTKDEKDLVLAIREFFRINDLSNILSVYNEKAMFRKTLGEENPYAIAVWLRICEIETNQKQELEFDKQKLISKLRDIKLLNLCDINYAINELKRILLECGVVFNVIHNVSGAPIQGAIIDSKNAIKMCITLRQKYADVFWFSVFHEIWHLLHLRVNSFVDFDDAETGVEENKANVFAANTLINEELYYEFVKTNIYKEDIVKFAAINNVLPCIVVGRLQHDNVIDYSQYNDLKIKYDWT